MKICEVADNLIKRRHQSDIVCWKFDVDIDSQTNRLPQMKFNGKLKLFVSSIIFRLVSGLKFSFDNFNKDKT